MKKIICLILLLSFMVAGIFAQAASKGSAKETMQQQPPFERAKAITDKINAVVQLSPEQYERVLKVFKTFYTQGTASERTGKPKADRDKKLQAILTAEQLQNLKNAWATEKNQKDN